MRILHTADWHLGKRLERFSRLEEQKQVLNEICDIAENKNVDVVLIAGDLFDVFNPSTEAVELFYKTLKRLSDNGRRAVVAIAGNHDSPERIEAPDPLARACGIYLSGFPNTLIPMDEEESEQSISVSNAAPGFLELKLDTYDYPLRLILTPYANEFRLKAFLGMENEEQELRDLLSESWKETAENFCDEQGVNILMAHLFVGKRGEPLPEETDDEKPILHVGGAQVIYSDNFPKNIQYVALGHLHRYQIIDTSPCPVVYSSSPLSYSFAEANQKKYVVILDLEPGMPVEMEKVELHCGRPLLRVKSQSVDEAVIWLQENPDALVELTLVSDTYISSEDRKRLNQAHECIITMIPEILTIKQESESRTGIDLQLSMEELFVQYFKSKHGQAPSESILQIFSEIRSQTVSE
jgi:exonuclease SbcD